MNKSDYNRHLLTQKHTENIAIIDKKEENIINKVSDKLKKENEEVKQKLELLMKLII
jgi:hypothetical protein